jgi:hypothetical protein
MFCQAARRRRERPGRKKERGALLLILSIFRQHDGAGWGNAGGDAGTRVKNLSNSSPLIFSLSSRYACHSVELVDMRLQVSPAFFRKQSQ